MAIKEPGEVSMLDDDDWIQDLVAESMAIETETNKIAKARKRLASGTVTRSERDELLSLVRAYEEARIWEAIAQVALIHVQPCGTCGHNEMMFQGWMIEQKHKFQPTTRRLVAGESPLHLPIRKERHYLKPRGQCIHCLDAYVRARQAIVPYQFVNNRKEEK